MKVIATLFLLLSSSIVFSQVHTVEIAFDMNYRNVDVRIRVYSPIDELIDSLTVYWGNADSTKAEVDWSLYSGNLFKGDCLFSYSYVSDSCYDISVPIGNYDSATKNLETGYFLTCHETVCVDTVTLSQGPIFNAGPESIYLGSSGEYLYSLAFFDLDGDSLFFVLEGFPNSMFGLPASEDTLFVNSQTGEFTWDKPLESGRYVLRFKGHEYRNERFLSTASQYLTVDVEYVSGFEELILSQEVYIYPNPVSNKAILSVTSNSLYEIGVPYEAIDFYLIGLNGIRHMITPIERVMFGDVYEYSLHLDEALKGSFFLMGEHNGKALFAGRVQIF